AHDIAPTTVYLQPALAESYVVSSRRECADRSFRNSALRIRVAHRPPVGRAAFLPLPSHSPATGSSKFHPAQEGSANIRCLPTPHRPSGSPVPSSNRQRT